MSTFGYNRPVFMKTYGRGTRKVEPWLSPDLRKKAFSFSSTFSSDPSFDASALNVNSKQPRKRKKKSTASASSKCMRAAKQKAMTALKEEDSDEENVFIPDTAPKNIVQSRRGKANIGMKRLQSLAESEQPKPVKYSRRKLQRAPSTSTSESEDMPVMNKNGNLRQQRKCAKDEKHTKPENAMDPPSLSRFVTDRRRVLSVKPRELNSKPSVPVPSVSLNSSSDFTKGLPLFPRYVTRRKHPAQRGALFVGNSSSDLTGVFPDLRQTRALLREVSFNDSDDQRPSCKKPLLSSTPSVRSKPTFRLQDPSISEIDFSHDETEDLPPHCGAGTRSPFRPESLGLQELPERGPEPQNVSVGHPPQNERAQRTGLGSRNRTAYQHSRELFSQLDCDAATPHLSRSGKNVEGSSLPLQEGLSAQTSVGAGFVSAKTHLDSLVEDAKERCRTVSSVVLLERTDISDILAERQQEGGEMYSSCVEGEVPVLDSQSAGQSRRAVETQQRNEMYTVHSSSSELLNRCEDDYQGGAEEHLTSRSPAGSSSSSSSSSSSCSSEAGDSACEAVDPVQCQVAELKARCLASRPTVSLPLLDLSEFLRSRRDARVQARTDATRAGRVQSASSSGSAPHTSPGSSGLGGHSERGAPRNAQVGLKRKQYEVFTSDSDSPPGRTVPGGARALSPPKGRAGTGRKACVSGVSVNRWTKRDMVERNRNRKKNAPAWSKAADGSLSDLLSAGLEKYSRDPTSSWLQSNSGIGLPATPLRTEQLNLSSLLANFTPNTLTTHTWSRLKAALSVHKKKTACVTPLRWAMSHLQSPGVRVPDASMELFGSPVCTPLSRVGMSRLIRSVPATPLTPCEEGISDVEKVYLECHQDGPLSFEECIPPHRMKLCRKIGEGTFGEVFSTTNDSGENVALKIIPVEGSQKVNGEDQKTFGEILHEIIISKELSSLDETENNQTKGFIGLLSLHCVRGSYPRKLLDSWDKFDKQRGSENDRPDFFGEDQFFLILEFEFGGSDLENMNGKLQSIAKAKSVLHQVTAALAVAEQALCFEHRDLHWGNILVKTTKQQQTTYILNGTQHSIETKGVHVNIIDYSLSRLEIDGLTVSCDISTDEELFMGQGDYQFDIYRKMREENNNTWSEYHPHSNVLWLHYLADKLLEMKYRSSAQAGQQRALRRDLAGFHGEIISFESATDALQRCSLFH